MLMAELMTFYTEAHQLLPMHHFGGRPGCTTSDAVHLLVHKIKDTWWKQQVTVVLFLDIEGAFPNAVTSRLLHSMRKRQLPEKLIAFTGLMLKNRHTTLRFADHTSEAVTLDNGIGQGDLLSMVLYQYYNTDILEIPNKPQESAEAYVDDAILTASSAKSHPLLLLLLGPFPFLSLLGILLHVLDTFHKHVEAFVPSQASRVMT